jgi:hypothetical protein
MVGVMEIFDEITQAVTDAGDFYSRMENAAAIRKAEWDGQSSDGRKHREALGREAFPWEGASDTRVRTVDEIVNEQAMLMLQAFTRARIQAAGMETSDAGWGMRMTTLLKYVLWTRMRGQMRRELALAAQWRQWFGASMTAVMWDQQLRRMEQEVTVEGLAVLLLTPEEAQNPEAAMAGVEAARMLVLDPSREEQALEVIMGLSPIVDRRRAKRGLEELRNTGRTMVDVPEVFAAEPRLMALLPMVDVFFPAATDDIQRAPWVAIREEISETDLRDRVNTYGYDEDFVEKAIEQKGARYDAAKSTWWASWRNENAWRERDLVEIFHVYRKEFRDGIPEVRCEVVSSAVPDVVGKDEPLPYAHGEYPVISHVREFLTRRLIDSRGVAELAQTWQNELKVQRDARTDRTAVTVLPPLIVPARRGATRLRIGPGVQIPAAGRNEQYEWMRTPPYDAGSIEIERATERSIARYFGRIDEAVPPQLTMLHQGDLVDGWLLEMRQVCTQVLQLCQQYMSEEQVTRITGRLDRGWQNSRAEIQGQFDLSVEADPRDLNLEMQKEKWGFVEIVMKYDRGGRVDYGKLIEWALAGIDPNMADAVLIPMEAANAKQVTEEQDVLAKMMAGIEPPMEPGPGMNYGLRMQVLQDTIGRNPEMQRRIAGQPDTAALVENRMKFLSFQVQQQENAQIGRVGTGEVL